MKSLVRLLESALADASVWCDTDTRRDIDFISRRVEHEGLSFLTITLPKFCKDFERSLDSAQIADGAFLGFKKSRRNSPLPAFLQGLTQRVFDRESGRLVSAPCVNAIFFVRQLTLMCKKVKVSCSPEREANAFAQYVKTDDEVRLWRPDKTLVGLSSVFDILFGEVLSKLDSLCSGFGLKGRHGPGAVFERVLPNQKYVFRQWPHRLNRSFPMEEFAIVNYSFREELENVDVLDSAAETPVRVVSVPKTLSSPRIIAIEPIAMQYAQQSIMRELVPALERGRTRGHLCFTDQGVNQRLALDGSSSCRLATLDLSEASDRVPAKLVWALLSPWPCFRNAVFDCRSTRALLPDGSIRVIRKFASMGSALCFPIEAMVFHAISTFGQLRDSRVSRRTVLEAASSTYTYGDDIIVPVSKVLDVVDTLESFNLKVNRSKSFWTGKFRESCGVDAYDGVPITPAYLRELLDDMTDASTLSSCVAFANQLYKKGLWHTARFMRSLLPKLPHVHDEAPILGYHSFQRLMSFQRWNATLHRWETRGLSVAVRRVADHLDGHAALLKCLANPSGEEVSRDHLETSVRRGGVRIKRHWATPY